MASHMTMVVSETIKMGSARTLILTLAAAAIAALYSTPAVAQSCSGEMCDDVVLERLYVSLDGYTYLRTNAEETGLSICTPFFSGKAVRMDQSSTIYDQTFAVLLTAHAQSAPISMRFRSDETGGCEVMYVY